MTEAGYRFAGRVPPGVDAVVPSPGQESVWDYPRPPRVDAVPERIRVIVGGIVVADSVSALRVVETASPPAYYVPPSDVRTDLLSVSRTTTVCEWKGAATYWTLRMGARVLPDVAWLVPDVAWSYERPNPGYERIAGHFAFYAGRVDEAWVGDEQAIPQPGDYYGGWVTSRIVGPFKGDRGTFGW